MRVPRRRRSSAFGHEYSTMAAPPPLSLLFLRRLLRRLLGGLGEILLGDAFGLLLVLDLAAGHQRRGGEHGLSHSGVGAAAAEVAGEAVMYVRQLGIGIAVEQGLGGHHEAGRTEA